MSFFARFLRIACVVSATLAPVAGASAFVLGQPWSPPGLVIRPVPPVKLPPTAELCLERFQRRADECSDMYACGWEAPMECFDNRDLCVDAALQKYDDCLARAFPVFTY